MANCTVSFTSSAGAISHAVKYVPEGNQVIDNIAIDTDPVTATVSLATYSAVLIQRARYRVKAPRFPFDDVLFTVPASSSANLQDLLTGIRKA